MIPAGAVTTADLYREMIGMRTDITRALTVLDAAHQIHQDHESRIRILERFRFTLLGAAIAVSAATSALGTWVGLHIHR
jgi:hypothetical protein